MRRVELQHSFGKQGGMTLLGSIITAHSSSQYIEKHVLSTAENITYSIDATYKSPTPSGMSRAIQLGTPFYITIEGDAKLGGFWNLDLVNITVVADRR